MSTKRLYYNVVRGEGAVLVRRQWGAEQPKISKVQNKLICVCFDLFLVSNEGSGATCASAVVPGRAETLWRLDLDGARQAKGQQRPQRHDWRRVGATGWETWGDAVTTI